MNITAKHNTETDKIVAKGGGKQRTVAFDHSKSEDWNIGNAAGTLALVLGLEWSEDIQHVNHPSGHAFIF